MVCQQTWQTKFRYTGCKVQLKHRNLVSFGKSVENVVATKDFNNGFIDKELIAIITEELGEGCAVGLNRQYADLYKVEDSNDGN